MNSRFLFMQVHGTKPKRAARRARFSRGPARSWKYKAWIRTLGCCCCGSDQAEAAHTGSDGGMKLKASDYSCIPLCTDCHTQATHSHHRDLAEFERRTFARLRMSIEQLVKHLNSEWKQGKAEAA